MSGSRFRSPSTLPLQRAPSTRAQPKPSTAACGACAPTTDGPGRYAFNALAHRDHSTVMPSTAPAYLLLFSVNGTICHHGSPSTRLECASLNAPPPIRDAANNGTLFTCPTTRRSPRLPLLNGHQRPALLNGWSWSCSAQRPGDQSPYLCSTSVTSCPTRRRCSAQRAHDLGRPCLQRPRGAALNGRRAQPSNADAPALLNVPADMQVAQRFHLIAPATGIADTFTPSTGRLPHVRSPQRHQPRRALNDPASSPAQLASMRPSVLPSTHHESDHPPLNATAGRHCSAQPSASRAFNCPKRTRPPPTCAPRHAASNGPANRHPHSPNGLSPCRSTQPHNEA